MNRRAKRRLDPLFVFVELPVCAGGGLLDDPDLGLPSAEDALLLLDGLVAALA